MKTTSNVHYVEQGSAAWKALRIGKATASRIADIFARTKSGPAASRKNYAAELVLERLVNEPGDFFESWQMKRGKELEPQARAEYELRCRVDVETVGFVDHPFIAWAGCSPDGFVGEEGLAEFKCPGAAMHLQYLRTGEVPADYAKQIVWTLACNPDRAWCDFTSFHPQFPAEMQLLTVRIERDPAAITEMERGVREFLGEVAAETDALRARFERRVAA